MIGSDNENNFTDTHELHLTSDDTLGVEYVFQDDWKGLLDPCPKFQGTKFDHMWYEGGHYGHHEDAVIQRTDYWDQKGSLYTVCRSSDTAGKRQQRYAV